MLSSMLAATLSHFLRFRSGPSPWHERRIFPGLPGPHQLVMGFRIHAVLFVYVVACCTGSLVMMIWWFPVPPKGF